MNHRENKKIGKLRRNELLEILLRQTELTEKYERAYYRSSTELKTLKEKNEVLEAEKQSLQKQLREMERKLNLASEKLEERKIHIEESGSIIEAAARINGLFEAAQKTVDDYINNARRFYENESNCSNF